jgi:hypothetical protein
VKDQQVYQACMNAHGTGPPMISIASKWDQFKTTRTAIYKGNADEAKKIADGIQSERLSKMWSIMSCKVR